MSGKVYLRNPNFFQRNYHEALKFIIPDYLFEDDLSGTPKSEDIVDLVINTHIDAANNISSILNVSSMEGSNFTDLSSLSGIAPYFVKQNNLTKVTTQSFENDILSFFDVKFSDFQSKEELSSFIDTKLLSSITLNNPNESVFSSLGSISAIHDHLISKLSWFYFLNTSGPTFSPSSYVKGLIVSSLYEGNKIDTLDGINGLTEYLWRNASSSFIPSMFVSGSSETTSGIQQLDKLKTWNQIIYSPLFADSSDFRVRDKFNLFMENSIKSSEKIESGPFARLIRALSFLAFDINNDTEEISTLYDIDDCPDELLPFISQLIGWDLFGNDPVRWRMQLRNAVSIYKSVGTKRAIQSTINTIFPKNNFPIEGRITELWESYVPFLIYYSLATESPFFRDFSTWTETIAATKGIEKYSYASMDENIKLAVDKIILDTIIQFPENFPINTWLSKFSGTFEYRGRDYPIPPFEEYPYYVNTELSFDMLRFITDQLVCFGVRQEFALDVSSFIESKALTNDDEPRLGSWLIFTSGYNQPPNLDSVIKDINNKDITYAPLWSGKSSHFKLVLDSSEFDFNKKDLKSISSGDVVPFAAKAISKFAPAHSIPLISLEVSASPDKFIFEDNCLPHIYLDGVELDKGAGGNRLASGIFFNSYKRGINSDGVVVDRKDLQSLVSPKFINLSAIGDIPRITARRKSFEKVMPFNGYYDRTGFNMPVSFDSSSGLSGIPLGLVPSSLSYTPVTSHINLPPIWNQCQNLNSNNTFFEYDVSNTQNIRGKSGSLKDNKDTTTDRGQLPGIYAAMHRVAESIKELKARNEIEENTSINIDQISLAASGTNANASGYTFPESVSNYYNFAFGRDLHRLYRIYQKNFKWHSLRPDIQSQDGANVFSHTFGPLVRNHDFEILGDDKPFTASSFSNTIKLEATSEPFTGSNSFLANADSSMYIGNFERVSTGLISEVELILTSGVTGQSFSVIRIPKSSKAPYEDEFLFDNTVVLMRSGDAPSGPPRVRFDISKYASTSQPVPNNFLSPDHDFILSLRSLISRDSGLTLGGRSVGVWIHTKPENGSMWSFDSKSNWVQHNQLISRTELINNYAHIKSFELEEHDPQTTTNSNSNTCLNLVSSTRTSPIIGLGSDDFRDFDIEFNTRNRDLILPYDYQKNFNQLHRLDQNYVVEVFMLPGSQPDEFLLLDTLKVQDLTLNKLSKIFADGTLSDPLCVLKDVVKECSEHRVSLSKQDIFDIFKHFNNIAGKNSVAANASRDKSKTSTIMGSEGGSRLDYRLPDELLLGVTFAATGNLKEEITIQV
tara:strand:- start:12843 stop:16748 length:3906 start_codon:yes stop_codon:yes gene_type:complete